MKPQKNTELALHVSRIRSVKKPKRAPAKHWIGLYRDMRWGHIPPPVQKVRFLDSALIPNPLWDGQIKMMVDHLLVQVGIGKLGAR